MPNPKRIDERTPQFLKELVPGEKYWIQITEATDLGPRQVWVEAEFFRYEAVKGGGLDAWTKDAGSGLFRIKGSKGKEYTGGYPLGLRSRGTLRRFSEGPGDVGDVIPPAGWVKPRPGTQPAPARSDRLGRQSEIIDIQVGDVHIVNGPNGWVEAEYLGVGSTPRGKTVMQFRPAEGKLIDLGFEVAYKVSKSTVFGLTLSATQATIIEKALLYWSETALRFGTDRDESRLRAAAAEEILNALQGTRR